MQRKAASDRGIVWLALSRRWRVVSVGESRGRRGAGTRRYGWQAGGTGTGLKGEAPGDSR